METQKQMLLKEKLQRAYSKDPCIDINQVVVLLSSDLTTGGNAKHDYTSNAL